MSKYIKLEDVEEIIEKHSYAVIIDLWMRKDINSLPSIDFEEIKPTDSDCIEFIKKSIQENPVQVLQWLLLNIGNTMWEMNADNITTDANMNDPRGWRMRVEMKIEKITPQ